MWIKHQWWVEHKLWQAHSFWHFITCVSQSQFNDALFKRHLLNTNPTAKIHFTISIKILRQHNIFFCILSLCKPSHVFNMRSLGTKICYHYGVGCLVAHHNQAVKKSFISVIFFFLFCIVKTDFIAMCCVRVLKSVRYIINTFVIGNLSFHFQCSSSCGRGLQSRVVQCMHRVTGRHGSDCPTVLKPPAYRQCHQGACNDRINVNTITSPRLGKRTKTLSIL